jgi:hypothetical protein
MAVPRLGSDVPDFSAWLTALSAIHRYGGIGARQTRSSNAGGITWLQLGGFPTYLQTASVRGV